VEAGLALNVFLSILLLRQLRMLLFAFSKHYRREGHNTAVDDVSIKVVDLEGRPVAGATIKFSGKDVGSTDRQGVDNGRASASQ
jgi:hypothetical protein